ncbi:MAG: hypothetical protein IMF26_06565 [Candidatus Fermentithermobacillus carboniphilus]|uniref:Uncharacterized protein n=1 Tax=Candidatus Fermentithermobacillus carboniphilus TaxID=3085328 RepID=A0AAT9L9M3_9FIRM|nr:MAG: hypothetical protein IMF26_06565 [Candidatus Fermentithermobacillus carboniphilus]
MSGKEKGIPGPFRETDLEKELRPRFQEYEEWRASQEENVTPVQETVPEQPKKKGGLTRLDLLFVAAGFLVAMFLRGCSGAK